jgi:hypothetical protein
MMDQLGYIRNSLNTARYALAGSRNSNSSFSFWWLCCTCYRATEEYDGTTWTIPGSLKYSKRVLAGAGTQTAALAFGGILHLIQEQQKNIMVQLGQL